MVTKSAPAERFMLALLEIAELQLAELHATSDIKAIYRIEGRARAMVSMARLAAAARPVTDTQTETEGGTMDDTGSGIDVRERLERRLDQLHVQIERKRAELAALEGGGGEGLPGLEPRSRGDGPAMVGLELDGA